MKPRLVVVLAVAVFAVLSWHVRAAPLERWRIVDVHAIIHGAIVVVRSASNHAAVVRVDGAGATQWTRVLPDPARWMGGDGSIMVVDGIAIVRHGPVNAEREPTLERASGFDVASGTWRWTLDLGPSRDGGLPLFVSGKGVGEHAVLFTVAEPVQLTAVVARTGEVVWTRSAEVNTAAASDRTLAVSGIHESAVIDVATGRTTRLETWGTGCLHAEEYIVADRGGRLIAMRADRTWRQLGGTDSGKLVACGYHGEQLVAVFDGHPHGGVSSFGPTPLERSLGTQLARIWRRVDNVWAGAPTLARYAPLHLFGEGTRTNLGMLDVASGEVMLHAKGMGDAVPIGRDWLVSDSAVQLRELRLYDGATGLERAHLDLDDADVALSWSLGAKRLAGNRLWLYSERESSLEALEVAIVDLPTFQLLRAATAQ